MSKFGKSVQHRACAVIGCKNSWRQLQKWMDSYCDEHEINFGIGKCVCDPPFELFTFPTKNNEERRKAWIKNIRRSSGPNKDCWEPGGSHRVCSEHFVNKRPTPDAPDPVLNMGHDFIKKVKHRRELVRIVPEENKCKISTTTVEHLCETETLENTSTCEPVVQNVREDHNYSTSTGEKIYFTCDCDSDCRCCKGCLRQAYIIETLKSQIQVLENDKLLKIRCLRKQNAVQRKTSMCEKLLTSDNKVRFYTGLVNKAMFEVLFGFLSEKVSKMRYWRGSKAVVNRIRRFSKSPKKLGQSRKLGHKDELLLTLMKLRLGLTEQDLSDRFDVSLTTVSSVFNTWIIVLSRELRPLIEYPPKENISSNLPVEAASFPNLRCIIDCTEIFIERPRSLLLQAQTWSDYKHHNTAKVLVGITPRGKFFFVSKAWAGRASDVHIVNQSGFLDKIDPFDEILADKGFTISNQLTLKRAKLVIPPGVNGREQLLSSEVEKTKRIANFRIHVERAILRSETCCAYAIKLCT